MSETNKVRRSKRKRHAAVRFDDEFDGIKKKSKRKKTKPQTEKLIFDGMLSRVQSRMKSYRPDQSIVCDICGRLFPPESNRNANFLLKHCLSHSESALYHCSYKDYECKSRTSMENHLKSIHRIAHLSSVYYTSSLEQQKEEIYGIIDTAFRNNEITIHAHLCNFVRQIVGTDLTKPNPVKCSICPKTFELARSSDILDHCISHSDIQAFQCNRCETKTGTKKAMRSHCLRRHSLAMRNEDFTESLEKYKEEIEESIVQCFGPREDDSEERSQPVSAVFLKFTRAVLEERAAKDFPQCNICSLNLRRKTIGQCSYDAFNHVLTHMETRFFHCNHCDQSLKTKHAVKMHLRRCHFIVDHTSQFSDSLLENESEILPMIRKCFAKDEGSSKELKVVNIANDTTADESFSTIATSPESSDLIEPEQKYFASDEKSPKEYKLLDFANDTAMDETSTATTTLSDPSELIESKEKLEIPRAPSPVVKLEKEDEEAIPLSSLPPLPPLKRMVPLQGASATPTSAPTLATMPPMMRRGLVDQSGQHPTMVQYGNSGVHVTNGQPILVPVIPTAFSMVNAQSVVLEMANDRTSGYASMPVFRIVPTKLIASPPVPMENVPATLKPKEEVDNSD